MVLSACSCSPRKTTCRCFRKHGSDNPPKNQQIGTAFIVDDVHFQVSLALEIDEKASSTSISGTKGQYPNKMVSDFFGSNSSFHVLWLMSPFIATERQGFAMSATRTTSTVPSKIARRPCLHSQDSNSPNFSNRVAIFNHEFLPLSRRFPFCLDLNVLYDKSWSPISIDVVFPDTLEGIVSKSDTAHKKYPHPLRIAKSRLDRRSSDRPTIQSVHLLSGRSDTLV